MPGSVERSEIMGFRPIVDETEHGALNVWEREVSAPLELEENTEATRRIEAGFRYQEFRFYQRANRVNEVLRSYNLGPEFEPGELIFNPITGQPAIDPERNVIIVHEEEGSLMATPLFINPMLLAKEIKRLKEEGKEFEVLQPFTDLGRGGVAVTFPANLGPRVPGGIEHHGLVSLIMERKGEPQDPLVVIRNKELLSKEILDKKVPFEPVRFSEETYKDLVRKLFVAKNFTGGYHLPKPPRGMISENPNVEAVYVNAQNAPFYTFVSIDLGERGKMGFETTPAQKLEDGRLRQAGVFAILHKDSKGEPLIAFVSQRRYTGNVSRLELPRGFEKRKVLLKRARFGELSEEIGIPGTELERHETASLFIPEDPIRANVEFEFNLIELPPEKRFNLQKLTEAAGEQERPGALLEELIPSWIKVKDLVDLVVEGEFVTDAHTSACLFTALLIKDAVIKASEFGQMGIILEKFQDWRKGGAILGVPRGNSRRMDQVLRGDLNPNTGPCRIWNRVGFSIHIAGLPEGSYEVVSLNRLLEEIKRGKADIVTTSSIFKTLVQKGLIAIDYKRI